MPLMKQNAVVPFGKHKGQPIEQLAADPEYCEWLMGQAWFVEKYAHIHTLIINNFGEPNETPEHNRLQLRFLDEPFRRQCERAIFLDQPCIVDGKHALPAHATALRFENQGWDVSWGLNLWDPGWSLRKFGPVKPIWYSYTSIEIFVECKPLLGDDFPAVLRTLHQYASRTLPRGFASMHEYAVILLAGEVRSQAGTLPQIKSFFARSGFRLHTVEEIESLSPLPYYTKEQLPIPVPSEEK